MPKNTVAIQGTIGSFHEQAAARLIDGEHQIVVCDSFRDVFKKVEDTQARYGVVAIENNIYGSINAVYALLAGSHLQVIGEVYLKVDQYLIAKNSRALNDLNNPRTRILSQAPALAQCEAWLNKNLPQATRIETNDTAGAVAEIMASDSENLLAIAGQHAADHYQAKIIKGPINDNQHNFTRFFLLQPENGLPKVANKTSIILKTGHTPGALYHALGVFENHQVNLTKIDSFPIAGDKWHYAFYVDYLSTDKSLIKELEKLGSTVKLLGQYQADEIVI